MALVCIAAAYVLLPGGNDGSQGDPMEQLDLRKKGGLELSSSPPLWKFKGFMEPGEVHAVLTRLLNSEFDACNRTAYEHKTLKGRSCARVPVHEEPGLQTFLARLGDVFQADISHASQIYAVRYKPGSPGVPAHVDKYHDKSRNDLSILVYLNTATHPSSGLTVFGKANVTVHPESGTVLAWMSSHSDSEHILSPVLAEETHDRFVLQIGLNLGRADLFEVPSIAAEGPHGGDFTPDCASWCNVYTCHVWGCLDCPKTVHGCNDLEEGKHCAGWCNAWTSNMTYCLGCSKMNTPALRGQNQTGNASVSGLEDGA